MVPIHTAALGVLVKHNHKRRSADNVLLYFRSSCKTFYRYQVGAPKTFLPIPIPGTALRSTSALDGPIKPYRFMSDAADRKGFRRWDLWNADQEHVVVEHAARGEACELRVGPSN